MPKNRLSVRDTLLGNDQRTAGTEVSPTYSSETYPRVVPGPRRAPVG